MEIEHSLIIPINFVCSKWLWRSSWQFLYSWNLLLAIIHWSMSFISTFM